MSILLLLLSVVFIILLTAKWNIHPFLALVLAALFFSLSSGMSFEMITQSINDGFGNTLGKIGLVIVFGIIIGAFLEQTGGAYKLAEFVLKIIGKSRVYEAMGLVGFIVSIPVFVDSGFMLLSPLNKSLTKKANLSLAGTAVVLMLGLMLSHILIPPTPGPIAAAGILMADVGLVMLLGLGIGLVSLIVAIIYSKRFASKTYIDPNPEMSAADLEKKMKHAPGAFRAFLPIVIPIILIIWKSVLELKQKELMAEQMWVKVIGFIGTPVIALFIGVLLAFTLPRKFDLKLYSTTGWVGKALTNASNIILITGAGGIFGTILQNSNIAEALTSVLSGLRTGIWLPFLLAAAIKTAQGSSTVALITAASIMAPIMGTLGFDTEIQKALVVIAIGAGSAVVSHANDSGFWVITQLSNMDVKTGYKLYSTGTLVVGTFAAFLVWIVALIVG